MQTFANLDHSALAWVARRRSRVLVSVMRGFSWSGNASTVALAFALVLSLLPSTAAWRAGVATLVGLALFWIVKRLVRRARPHGSLIAAPDPFSLPSGHATCAWAIALSLSTTPLAGPAALWAIAVSLSRVILGVHYPLDTVVGALIGSFAAAMAAVWV